MIGGIVIFIGYLLKKINHQLRNPIFAYLIACLAIFAFQNWTINHGNRWQILIYDQLAMRLLSDSQATQFFKEAGLPISDDLMKITGMISYEYQNYLKYDPSMRLVREWIETRGKETYIRYLLSHPVTSMLKPFSQINKLISGSNLEYRNPKHMAIPIMQPAASLTNLFYPRQGIILAAILFLVMIGQWIYWTHKAPQQHAWIILTIILLSLYPLMFITWNGNPMEIERHAAQISIQFRLLGCMTIPMLLNEIIHIS